MFFLEFKFKWSYFKNKYVLHLLYNFNLHIMIKLVMTTFSVLVGLTTMHATVPLDTNPTVAKTYIEQSKEITITLERLTVDETFDNTVGILLDKQVDNGGIINVNSDQTNLYVTYSKTITQTKGDINLTIKNEPNHTAVLKTLKRMTIDNTHSVSLAYSNYDFNLEIKRSKQR